MYPFSHLLDGLKEAFQDDEPVIKSIECIAPDRLDSTDGVSRTH